MSKFWGLTVSAGKKFKQHVPEAFCVSGAAVEPVGGGEGNPVQLYLQQDDNDYLICSFSPAQGPLQSLLNVRIGSGETVGFHLKGGSGKSKIHLTGYTLPPGGGVSTPTNPPFKGQQKSILVTQPKSDDKQKKRVSIVETEPYGEREMESDDDDDDDDETPTDIRKKLFNGDSLEDSDDDDDDDDDLDDDDDDDLDDDDDDDDDEEDDSDSDANEGEVEELKQLNVKGKYNPVTGGKMDMDEDSDLELLDSDDANEDDDSDDSDDGMASAKNNLNNSKSVNQSKQKDNKNKSNNSSMNATPQKQGDNKNKNAAGSDTLKTPENQTKLKAPSSAGHTPMQSAMKTFSKGGVLVNELKIGNGQVAKLGKMVTVYYSGRLKSTNKQFDSSQGGPGFKFRLGKGEVIRGWDLGVEGMKVGGKRRMTIPAQLGYGKKGAPPDIPPNSTLVFEVELKHVS